MGDLIWGNPQAAPTSSSRWQDKNNGFEFKTPTAPPSSALTSLDIAGMGTGVPELPQNPAPAARDWSFFDTPSAIDPKTGKVVLGKKGLVSTAAVGLDALANMYTGIMGIQNQRRNLDMQNRAFQHQMALDYRNYENQARTFNANQHDTLHTRFADRGLGKAGAAAADALSAERALSTQLNA